MMHYKAAKANVRTMLCWSQQKQKDARISILTFMILLSLLAKELQAHSYPLTWWKTVLLRTTVN